MLRPWNHSRGTLAIDGEENFRLGDVAWRRTLLQSSPGFGAPQAALSLAQRRKCLNLYAQLTGELDAAGDVQLAPAVTVEHVVRAFASVHFDAAGLPFDEQHAVVTASLAWFDAMRALNAAAPTADVIARDNWLPTCAALLNSFAGDEFPDWLLAPHREQFRLATPRCLLGDEELRLDEWLAWRPKVCRFSPEQLSRATRCDGWGGQQPSLEQVFKAADVTRQKLVQMPDYMALVKRWWSLSGAWDELNAYGL